ncbi:MAG: NnrU family protein [Proteobacteria bacterium]|nr:NnrU family protein [Pseudomonadota bacterium]
MTGSLTSLALAAVFFVASHFILSYPPVRGVLASRLGEKAFRAVHGAVALGAIIWLVKAYGAAPYWELWPTATWMRHVALIVMPFAAILLVAGLTARNPTAMYWNNPESGQNIPGILMVTRHPVMWAITLWALAHMIPNGDVASLIFFAAFAGLALAGMPAIDRRRRAMMGAAWESFEAATSLLPFAAVAGGRAKVSLGRIGVWRIAGGVLLYGILLFGHRAVIGVSPLI